MRLLDRGGIAPALRLQFVVEQSLPVPLPELGEDHKRHAIHDGPYVQGPKAPADEAEASESDNDKPTHYDAIDRGNPFALSQPDLLPVDRLGDPGSRLVYRAERDRVDDEPDYDHSHWY